MLYDLCTIANRDQEIFSIGNNTFEKVYPSGVQKDTPINTLVENAIAAAHLGRADELKYMIINQIRGLTPDKDYCDWDGIGRVGVLPNRLSLREGPGAIDCQRLGRAASALHAGMLQSGPAEPAGENEIHVFPAFPQDWNGAFSLLARGGFQVTASFKKGQVEGVEIQSLTGGICRIQNPWPGKSLSLYRHNKKSETVSGSFLEIPVTKGAFVVLIPAEVKLPQKIKIN
jgi:hypothetical protein